MTKLVFLLSLFFRGGGGEKSTKGKKEILKSTRGSVLAIVLTHFPVALITLRYLSFNRPSLYLQSIGINNYLFN